MPTRIPIMTARVNAASNPRPHGALGASGNRATPGPTVAARAGALALTLLIGAQAWSAQSVAINEIFYHPVSGDAREEFLELHNHGTTPVDLDGWRLSRGVRYVFPPLPLPAGGFVVVAADVAVFRAKHPAVTGPVVGNWTGTLSRRGERIELEDAQGNRVDRVTYADEGDWADRQLSKDWLGYPTWDWVAGHKGGGKSLELVDVGRNHDQGQNWRASQVEGGTPGQTNSVAAVTRAPFITAVAHHPAVPGSADAVTITARVEPSPGDQSAVWLHHRRDGEASFQVETMHDDGSDGDDQPGDGVYAAVLPAQTNLSVVEFYVSATVPGGGQRLWPADPLPLGTERANLLYQVNDDAFSGTQPFHLLILKEADRAAYVTRVSQRPGLFSNATTSATFVSLQDGDAEVRYLVDVRNRGQGSRYANVMNFRVDFLSDALWQGVEKINLNAYFPVPQVLGGAVAQLAGFAMPESRIVQVRFNGANPSPPTPSRYGVYAYNEVPDGDYAARHHLGQANVYRALRDYSGIEPDLSYRGESADLYRRDYFKETNQSEDDWRDLIALTRALDPSQTPDDQYVAAVQQHVAVANWMRYFALDVLLMNRETAFGNGIGDDYVFYPDLETGLVHLVPWDLDTIFNLGDTVAAPDAPLFQATRLPVVNRFLKRPEFAPVYYAELLDLAHGIFAPNRLAQIAAQTVQDVLPEATLRSALNYAEGRRQSVLSQIPLALTVEHSLPVKSGYPHSTNATIALQGRAHAVTTRAVAVNGQPAAWSAWEARWQAPAVPLAPGLNRLLVQAVDGQGREIERRWLEVWHETAGVENVPAQLTGPITWEAAAGPRLVSGTVTLASDGTLTIGPGVNVQFAPGAQLVIHGRLVANGSDAGRIRFGPPPGTSGLWGGIVFEDSRAENLLANVDIGFAEAGTAAVSVRRSRAEFRQVEWAAASRPALIFEEASLNVSHCRFGRTGAANTVSGSWVLGDGELVFRDNDWPELDGPGFALEIAGARRPGPIVELHDNRFGGSPANGLKLIDADALLDGNRFAGGSPGAGVAIDVAGDPVAPVALFLTRNHFSGLAQAVHARDAVALTIRNNSFHALRDAGLGFEAVTVGGAAKTRVEVLNSVFSDVPALLTGPAAPSSPDRLSVRWSLFSQSPLVAGEGNASGDARFAVSGGRLQPQPGSAVFGQGYWGWDIGAAVPREPAIHSVAVSPTPSRRLTAQVYAPGARTVSARLDGGADGPVQTVEQPLEFSGLAPGSHLLVVRTWDWLGRPIETAAPTTFRWRVDPLAPPVLLSEVKARDREAAIGGPAAESWIEVENRGDESVALAGLGLTDTLVTPHRFQFGPDATLAPGERQVVTAAEMGFTISPSGEQVSLFGSVSTGGRLLDTVAFGPQADGLSVARLPGGDWQLARPTPGAANRPAPVGDPFNLRINEWLTRGRTADQDEFVELYNLDPLPVALSGLSLSDLPGTLPRRQVFRPLTFISGQSWLALLAGGDPAGPRLGLEFGLTSDQGLLGLLDADGRWIDAVWYPPQQRGISWGRDPDGGTNLTSFSLPLPGAPNRLPASTNTTGAIELAGFTALWRYDDRGTNAGTAWREPAFDDSNWPTGRALFYAKSAPLPQPTNTVVPLGPLAYYFRLHFTWPLDQPPAQLRCWTVLDDGAVLYLNGREVRRIGLAPDIPVLPDTVANRAVIDAVVEGPFDLPATDVRPGENVLAVEVHQVTTYSSDLTWGLRLEAMVTNVPPARIQLNEVLADNRSAWLPDGYSGDWIELRNLSPYSADLTDLSLTDDPTAPRRFVFPPGTTLAGNSLRIVRCDPSHPASPENTGFGLDRDGDAVYLFDALARGGLLDSVVFGFQAPDVSLARMPAEPYAWQPAPPSPGAPNAGYAATSFAGVHINEWMARPASGEDWFELCNTGPTPVDLGGCYLSDDLTNPTLHRLRDHSILGRGWFRYQVLVADGSTAPSTHVAFRLGAGGERIALRDPTGQLIDEVTFGPQSTDVSEGRLPDGASTVVAFVGSASPGAENYRDSDRDRLPDAWEVQWGLDPGSPDDAALDNDHDGFSNLDEFHAGTNPTDPGSRLTLELLARPDGPPWVRFQAQPGRTYTLEGTDGSQTFAWTPLATVKARATAEILTLSPGAAAAQRFFRLRAE